MSGVGWDGLGLDTMIVEFMSGRRGLCGGFMRLWISLAEYPLLLSPWFIYSMSFVNI